MPDLFSETSLKQFFYAIYSILKQSTPEVTEIWSEMSDIEYFNGLSQDEIKEFVSYFDFVSIKKGNYIEYVVINKILFIIRSFKYLQYDITFLSNLLNYDGFEALVRLILMENGYNTSKNYRFSDKSNFKSKTHQTKYEIDVIGIDRNKILLIDCKQWKRKDSYSAINKAANLQFRRGLALKNNLEILSEMILSILGIRKIQKVKPPFVIIPLMVTLENNWIKINENSVPIVGISNFNSFLQELTNNLYYFKTIRINKLHIQKQLL